MQWKLSSRLVLLTLYCNHISYFTAIASNYLNACDFLPKYQRYNNWNDTKEGLLRPWERELESTPAVLWSKSLLRTHRSSISPSCLRAAFKHADPKSEKKFSQVISVFFPFWNLPVQKRLIKCWWNWHPGLNFINVLYTAFTRSDPKSVKKTVKLSIFFMLSGSTSVKAAHKMLVKLTPNPLSL